MTSHLVYPSEIYSVSNYLRRIWETMMSHFVYLLKLTEDDSRDSDYESFNSIVRTS